MGASHNQAGVPTSHQMFSGGSTTAPRHYRSPASEGERTLQLATPPGWTAEAKCLGRYDGKWDRDYLKEKECRALCAGCPVLSQCLTKALEDEGDVVARNRYGVFGGLGPVGRARLDEAIKSGEVSLLTASRSS